MPKKSSILRLPKVSHEKLSLEDFELTEEEIRDSRVKNIWKAYDENFDFLHGKDKIVLNRIVCSILGGYWRVMEQGTYADYELRKHLTEYRSLLEKQPYLKRILHV